MKENISRSSIFRSKMKLDAAKRNEEKLAEDVKRSEENRKKQILHSGITASLSKEDIEK